VTDVDTFAATVIPTFYKHSNWASFVRQLNFYGFRKIRSDMSVNSPLLWEFAHPCFVRGKPHLLADIVKKPSHSHIGIAPSGVNGYVTVTTNSPAAINADGSNAASEEVHMLRQTVIDLQQQVTSMSSVLQSLTETVNILQKEVNASKIYASTAAIVAAESKTSAPSKKRKSRLGALPVADSSYTAPFGCALPQARPMSEELSGDNMNGSELVALGTFAGCLDDDMDGMNAEFSGGEQLSERSSFDVHASSAYDHIVGGGYDVIDMMCTLDARDNDLDKASFEFAPPFTHYVEDQKRSWLRRRMGLVKMASHIWTLRLQLWPLRLLLSSQQKWRLHMRYLYLRLLTWLLLLVHCQQPLKSVLLTD